MSITARPIHACIYLLVPRCNEMRWVLRLFGALNLMVSVFGLIYFGWGIKIHIGKWPGDPGPSQWAVFLLIAAVSTALVCYQAYLGVRLTRNCARALQQLAWVLASEIVLVFAHSLVTWIIHPASLPAHALWFWAIALFPLDPQVMSGYAFIGLFAALVLGPYARRAAKMQAKLISQ